ncbi:MAG: hypothetical protein ACI4II_06820, partial [Acutalibacteraceae bacterium]
CSRVVIYTGQQANYPISSKLSPVSRTESAQRSITPNVEPIACIAYSSAECHKKYNARKIV